jgi:flagellar basal-body rod protein FlgC
MSVANIFGIAGSALNAQTVRMNLAASNLANASTSAGSVDEAYKAKRPVFQALMEQQHTTSGAPNLGGVKIDKIIDDKSSTPRVFEPNNPQADKDGYVYKSNVSEIAETVEMMAAARSYQNNIEVVNTARQLMLRTLDIIKG